MLLLYGKLPRAYLAEPKDPQKGVLYSILKLFCNSEEPACRQDRFRSGGLGYREVKQAIFDRFMEKFGPAREPEETA